MSGGDTIPLPVPTALSQPHWDGCRDGKLLVQRCDKCNAYVFIPQHCCTACQSRDLSWVESSGHGQVYAFSIVHRPPRPQFEAPYVVAIIELEEGWHMLSNVVNCATEDVFVGMPVAVTFEALSDEITLPYFQPAAGARSR